MLFNLSEGDIVQQKWIEDNLDTYDFLMRVYCKQVKVLKEMEASQPKK
jgi:hypothetical protein